MQPHRAASTAVDSQSCLWHIWIVFMSNYFKHIFTVIADNFYKTKEERGATVDWRTTLHDSFKHRYFQSHRGMYFFCLFFFLFSSASTEGYSSNHGPLMHASASRLKLPVPHLLHLYNREAARCRTHLNRGPRLNNIN